MYSFQSLINFIDINDVPAATTILEELSIQPDEHPQRVALNFREALKKAIENKSLKLLTLLCNSELFTRHNDFETNQLVRNCISVDFPEGIKFLLSKGIILQQDRNEYNNPLLQCVREDKLEVLKYFLTVPGINKNPNPDNSLIMEACAYQNVNVLSYLVNSDQKRSINSICKITGYTPLHQCINRDNIKSVKILVEAGANVNIVGRYEQKIQTPIVMAAEKGMPSVVMYLMDHGANIHISARNPNTLLHYLARSGNTSDEMGQCIDRLIKAGVPVDKVNIRNETPIYLAAHRSNIAVLKSLIQGKCNLNIRCGNQQKSPLSASVTFRNIEATELLLKAGCDVDLIDGTGVTPFVEVTRKRKVNFMKLLVSHGANVNVKDHLNKATPSLSAAVDAGDSDLTEMLLNAGADSNIKDGNGRAALSIAIENNHLPLTELLLKAGVDANITDDKGRTPLFIAIVNNHITLTEMLLKAGVDANITDDKGGTPLCTAIKNYSRMGSNTIHTHVFNRFTGLRAVNRMSQTEVIELVKILIEAGANVNQVCQTGECDENTSTPVFMAADKEMHSVVMCLIDHDANLDINSVNQDTLLHYIARSNDTSHELGQCVDKLIKAGVPVDKVNIRNETPIYLAAHRSNIAVLKALIKGKCNLNIRCGNQQKCPLSASVTAGNTEATERLLKAGCDVDLIDGTGITPFVEATRKHEVNLMKLLVSHGANVNVKDHLNKATPALSVAVQAGDSDLTEMLLNAGADSNIKYDNGRTALSIAIENNNMPLTEILLNAGVDANITDDTGGTPLCTAIKNYSRTGSNDGYRVARRIRACVPNSRSVNQMTQTMVFEFVKILIEAGASVNQVCKNGECGKKTSTPVFMAADKEMHSVVMYLIDHGANLDMNSVNQDTFLHYIVRSKDRSHEMDQCVDKLINAGVSVNQVNTSNETPLYLAALQSNKVVLEALINANCDLNTLCGVPLGLSVVSENTKPLLSSANLFNNDIATRCCVSTSRNNLLASNNIDATNKNTCSTALIAAVRIGHIQITDMLLKAGADTNVKDGNGRTVLMIATEKHNMIITNMILKAGVDPNIKDDCGRTALFYMCFMPKYTSQGEVLKCLKQFVEAGAYIDETYQIEEGLTQTPICAAAKNTMPCVVIYLMEHGANIHPDIENQNTLLHYLARSEDTSCDMIQCVDMLVKAGLSVNKVNGSNETPLYHAVQNSNNAIVETLLKEKCDLNIPCGDNKGSLLAESVKNLGNDEVIATLLNAGCDANLPDGDGDTPLLLATRYKFVEQMQLLVQHGAQVNISDKNNGRTPLMLAIENQSTNLANCLMQAGAVVNTKDDHGCTALHYMYNTGYPSSRTWINLMKLLMIKGCDTSIECSKNHMSDLSQLMLKTNSVKLIWFCITDNWYPKDINGTHITPTRIFGIEDTLELAKTLYTCDVISSVWSDEWFTFRSAATSQSDDQENQKLLFHKFICSEDLKSRCRKVIRSCIGSNIKYKINEIEIPTTVKNFILLKDVIPEVYFTLAIDDDSDHSDDVSDRSFYSDSDTDDYSDNDYDYYGGYVDYFHSRSIDYDVYDCMYSSD